jgi:hypothetical protein
MANKSSTQSILEFSQIKNGVIVMKDKSFRSIVMVSSTNFALKSEEEQNAILSQFQNFLNSLDFTCQILIQSRKINITSYLDKFKELEKNEKNDLIKILINDYYNFVNQIVGQGTIMQKNFYLIVPFSMGEASSLNEEKANIKIALKNLTEDLFQRAKTQLLQRVEFLVLGLRRCGLQAIPLNTKEIIEFLWSFYHPQEAEKGYYPELPPEFII